VAVAEAIREVEEVGGTQVEQEGEGEEEE